jgi:hypothetical protein
MTGTQGTQALNGVDPLASFRDAGGAGAADLLSGLLDGVGGGVGGAGGGLEDLLPIKK